MIRLAREIADMAATELLGCSSDRRISQDGLAHKIADRMAADPAMAEYRAQQSASLRALADQRTREDSEVGDQP
jgi:hypothetical protein